MSFRWIARAGTVVAELVAVTPMTSSPRACDAVQGMLRFVHDVSIDATVAGGIVVRADVPLARNAPAVLELPGELGTRVRVDVTAESAEPLVVDGVRGWRLRLRLAPQAHARALGRTAHGEALRLPALGVLVRCVPVFVRGVHASGCELDAVEDVSEAVAQLEIPSETGRRVETVRLRETTHVPGRLCPWSARADFLSAGSRVSRRTRNLMARFEIMDELVTGGEEDDRAGPGVVQAPWDSHA